MRKRGGFNFELRNQDMDFDNNKNVKIAKRGNDPDFLFYNAQIINNSTATTQKYDDPEIAYQDTRTVPILEDKSKYAISVENFTINGAGKNLPIFIPQIREYNIDGSLNSINFLKKSSLINFVNGVLNVYTLISESG